MAKAHDNRRGHEPSLEIAVIPAFASDMVLSRGDFTFFAEQLPLYSHMLGLCP